MTIYYAHAMKEYDTLKERSERAFLEKMFTVVCPNRDVKNQSHENIEEFLELAAKTDAIVASPHKGYIGSGVYAECQHMLKLNKPVYILKSTPKGYEFEELKSIDRIKGNSTKYAVIESESTPICRTFMFKAFVA